MRNLAKFLTIGFVALFFAQNSFAQSSTRPWLFDAGFSAVDFNVIDTFGDFFQTETWNSSPVISKFTLGHTLNPSLALDLQLEATRIHTLQEGVEVGGRGFFNGDLNLRYKFDNGYIIKENSVGAPYIFAGAGASYMSDDATRFNANVGLGLNLFLWRDFGLFVQTVYNYAPNETENNVDIKHSFFEHSAGLALRFGIIDTDDDGIPDEEDACPNEAGPATTHGCPDKDGDGIPDKTDACPDQPGLASMNGCPDSDGDGVADKDDKCPSEKGLKEMQGCPDRDADGIADKDDQCPDQKGLAQFNGCPDTDGDGVPDKSDACPTQKGSPALQGCPDRDGDGVADNKDRCPDEAGPASNGGCPIPKQEEIEKINVQAHAIQFVTGSDKIQKSSYKLLDDIVAIMNKYPQTKWDIQGHTDNVGSDASNQKLSERRAASVKKYFTDKGVNGDRMQSEGYGETKPVADNKTAAGRAQNRRTEILLIQQE